MFSVVRCATGRERTDPAEQPWSLSTLGQSALKIVSAPAL
jgi:hypothetical protein